MSEQALLDVQHLDVRYHATRGTAPALAVKDVSFAVRAGETVGLVGESGSGKTSIGKAILGLVKPTAGTIGFQGRDISRRDLGTRRWLAHQLQVIFQDPNSSLNPTRTIGSSLMEPLLVGKQGTHGAASERARDMLARVGLPRDAMSRYPSAFSGGQRQRIAIARALVMQPKLIICDEPVSSLDLSVQAQVLNLLVELQVRDQISYLFISHDLSVVRHMCHSIMVLQRGQIVEHGSADQLWNSPTHPYTRTLIDAVPEHDPAKRRSGKDATGSGMMA